MIRAFRRHHDERQDNGLFPVFRPRISHLPLPIKFNHRDSPIKGTPTRGGLDAASIVDRGKNRRNVAEEFQSV
jgi:hypothetical protein